jgi:hypothetical protein
LSLRVGKKSVISTEGGALAAGVERTPHFAFDVVFAFALAFEIARTTPFGP